MVFTSHTSAIGSFDKASIEVVTLDTGQRTNTRENPLEQEIPPCRIVVGREPSQPYGGDAIGVETRIDANQARKTCDQQRGAAQQHDGNGRLHEDERLTQS